MSHRAALIVWIKAHMPELGARLRMMPLRAVCRELNTITGEQVSSASNVEHGSKRFLDALKRNRVMDITRDLCSR